MLNPLELYVKLLDIRGRRTDAKTPEAAALRKQLARNGRRRDRARAEMEAARDELVELLAEGRMADLTVTTMARDARVSRETAHALLEPRR